MVRQRRRTSIGVLGAACLLLVATACEPPGKPEQEPVASNQLTDFKALYNENCSGCHGDNGREGPGRILNDPLYLAVMPREALKQTIENGRPGTAMPPWLRSNGGPLTEKQVEALVNGIESWAKPASIHGARLPSYSAGSMTGDENRGRKLFARDCFMCHGPGAKVGTITDPVYLSLVSDQMLRTSIIVGRPDLGMPDYRFLNMGRALTDQDITDIVAFLVSKRPPSAATAPHPEVTSATREMQPGAGGAPVNTNQSGNSGEVTRGNEGSGTGPGTRHKEQGEGLRSTGSSSQRGVSSKEKGSK